MNQTIFHTGRRMLLMTVGRLDVFTAKTAVMLLRYCPDQVVGVLDPVHAGGNLRERVGVDTDVPIVDSLAAALPLGPNQLVVGVALPGRKAFDDWRNLFLEALENGLDIVNGLHGFVADDPVLVCAAETHGRRIVDLRRVVRDYPLGTGRAKGTRARRVLTVGTDCNVGKMLTALELTRDIQTRIGRPGSAVFVATGQTGVLVAGRGEVLDAVKSDFVAGAAETLVLEEDRENPDYIVVEGQGSLLHPGFSAVTLGLLHGVLPDEIVLCHEPGRAKMRQTDLPVPSLAEMIDLYERICRPIHPARVVGVAVNTFAMPAEQAEQAMESTRRETGLVVADCIRTGVAPLTDAVLKSFT